MGYGLSIITPLHFSDGVDMPVWWRNGKYISDGKMKEFDEDNYSLTCHVK